MAKVIDYYLFMISPWAYLGGPRLAEIARRHGAEIRVKPIDMATVFPETGGVPMAKRAPARLDYRLAELRRWRDHLGLPLNGRPRPGDPDRRLGRGARRLRRRDPRGHCSGDRPRRRSPLGRGRARGDRRGLRGL
jgi:2-hydroxychromene-2-carboxylate isomerase